MKDEIPLLEGTPGIFPRIVTHEQARGSAKNFIDAHFGNKDGKGVLTGIPARPDHDDLLLTDYIRQQAARDAAAPDLARKAASADKLVEALEIRDAKASECPVDKGKFRGVACGDCGALPSESCIKKSLADSAFVDYARQALATHRSQPWTT
jgi:hypothetical protein